MSVLTLALCARAKLASSQLLLSAH